MPMTHRCHLENSAARFAANGRTIPNLHGDVTLSRASSARYGELVYATEARRRGIHPLDGIRHARLYAEPRHCLLLCLSLGVSPVIPRLVFTREPECIVRYDLFKYHHRTDSLDTSIVPVSKLSRKRQVGIAV